MQLDLIQRPKLEVRPAPGSDEPRLWIRRLVIWTPARLIQDVEFRRGLNIIWSPDPDDKAQGETNPSTGSGHGAGKTLVCRLLRYCLGEERFASSVVRTKIADALETGRVGIEARVDGRDWAVIRSLDLPRDVVRETRRLEDISSESVPATGIEPFIRAIAAPIYESSVIASIAKDATEGWLMGLAWLARDQECRFSKLTEWRSRRSGSASPAEGLSDHEALDIIRALLGAKSSEEHALEREIASLGEKIEATNADARRQQWLVDRTLKRAAQTTGLDEQALPKGELAIPVLRDAANARLSKVAVVPAAQEAESIEGLERLRDQSVDEVAALETALHTAGSDHAGAQMVIGKLAPQRAVLHANLADAQDPICPVCAVPIDKVLAQGCKLSHEMGDLASARERWERNEADLDEACEKRDQAAERRDQAKDELRAARSKLAAITARLVQLRQLHAERRDAWYNAQKLRDDLRELEDLMASTSSVDQASAQLKIEREAKNEELARRRADPSDNLSRLAEIFDGVVRELMGEDATGRLKLDGRGLHPKVEQGGEKSTPAIESAKIVAFDLAALLRSIEGGTSFPGLLIHDSPREADLGLSIYHRLFRYVAQLAQLGPNPLFQYIVTTTTRPPTELCALPWLALTLHGAPADERLLKTDL